VGKKTGGGGRVAGGKFEKKTKKKNKKKNKKKKTKNNKPKRTNGNRKMELLAQNSMGEKSRF